MFTHPEEVKMLFELIGSNESSIFILKIVGFLEIIWGVMWLLPLQKRKLFIVHIILLIGLTYSGRIYEYH